MSSQRMSAQGPSNNGLARTDPYAAHTTQCTGSLREIALWLLLAAFLLMLLSDAAHAAERGTPGLNIQPRLECQPTRSKPYAVKSPFGHGRERQRGELYRRRTARSRAVSEGMVAIRYGRPRHV